jgi:hypothetical protein
MMGLQADSRYISRATLVGGVTVESIKMALDAKMDNLQEAWAAACSEGRSPKVPPFMLGVLGVGTHNLHVREGRNARFHNEW